MVKLKLLSFVIPPLGGWSFLTFFRKVRKKDLENTVNPVFLNLFKIESIHYSISVIFRVIPWLIPIFTIAASRVGVAEQAIVVAGLLAVGADVHRYFAAAAGFYPLTGVFSQGYTTGIQFH